MNSISFPSHRRPGATPRAALLGLIFGAVAGLEGRADWTHYRGPKQDGIYREAIRTNWTAQPPKLLWRKPADPALSSVTLKDGRLHTQARRRVGGIDREFAIALDAATGRELWAVDLDLADYPHGGVGNDDGPRSTPVLDGDRVYVFTSYLQLYCLEAASGKQVWKRDFPSELGSTVVEWQNAASPAIVGDLLFVNGNGSPNRLMAIRKSDGTTAWRKHDETMTQASPVPATIAGVPQVIFFTKAGLTGVKPETGDALWRFAFPFSTSTAASPVVAGDMVYCSAAYTMGSGAVRLSPNGNSVTATQLWKKRNANMNHWATPVHREGKIYGIFGQSVTSVRCVDLATGNQLWQAPSVGRSRQVGVGSILLVHDLLFIVTDTGEVVLAQPDPTGYHEIDRFQAVQGKTWNNVALDRGLLYARSTTEIAVWDLAPPAPPAPSKLAPAVEFANGHARITLRAGDGSPLPPSRATNISLLFSEDPSTPTSSWLPLNAPARLNGISYQIEDPSPISAGSRRFYRARETP